MAPYKEFMGKKIYWLIFLLMNPIAAQVSQTINYQVIETLVDKLTIQSKQLFPFVYRATPYATQSAKDPNRPQLLLLSILWKLDIKTLTPKQLHQFKKMEKQIIEELQTHGQVSAITDEQWWTLLITPFIKMFPLNEEQTQNVQFLRTTILELIPQFLETYPWINQTQFLRFYYLELQDDLGQRTPFTFPDGSLTTRRWQGRIVSNPMTWENFKYAKNSDWIIFRDGFVKFLIENQTNLLLADGAFMQNLKQFWGKESSLPFK